MQNFGTLVSYFSKQHEAREAYRKLKRKGYRRIAWIDGSGTGKIRVRDPFSRHLLISTILSAVLFTTLAELLFAGFVWSRPLPGLFWQFLFSFLTGGFIGALIILAWMRRSRYGVEKDLIEKHSRWLVSGETAILLQGPIETLNTPYSLILETGERPPVVFVLHPECPDKPGADWIPGGPPLTPAKFQSHAQHQAVEHKLQSKPHRNITLLKRLEDGRKQVHNICQSLSQASHLEQSLPPTAEWLLDNEYIYESNARDVRLNLPGKFYRELPTLKNGPYSGLPRIYALARELVINTDLHLDQENILSYIQAYQSVTPLSIGELWAVPQVLRISLLEKIRIIARRTMSELCEGKLADFWANRIIAANRIDPRQLFSILAELAESRTHPNPSFAVQLLDYLYDQRSVLVTVRNWLERIFNKPLNELNLREKNRQIKDQVTIGNAFNSLRFLALLDWKECFEKLSSVEQTLRQDPAGIYPQMDFATRNRYRQAVEELHRGSGRSESLVALSAIEMAAGEAAQIHSKSGHDDLTAHVGTYLIGEKRKELSQFLRCRENPGFRLLQWINHHHTAVYLTGLIFNIALIYMILAPSLMFHTARIQLLLAALLIIPVSQLALEGLNYLFVRLLPPRALPKMDFQNSGIPDNCRTLVIVPMMLTDLDTIQEEAEKLEIRYLANRDPNLLFGLFSDFRDSLQPHCESDQPLLEAMRQRVQDLSDRYGGEQFYLFHRERTWSVSEQKYIGWERKRGKLEELNELIIGRRPESAEPIVHVGDQDQLHKVRFVITLDSDTQLPHNSARRMIETLAHPLNRVRFDSTGRVLSGYTIIQPRVTPSLPSADGTPFTRLFSNPVGIDPYTNAVSDVYQDLTLSGSYYGKGIYDVRSFSWQLSGRFPPETLLSHDLIEGAHVRVGLASDIELYDEYPQNYLSYIKRQHRWIRGDWQIADWILPRVPKPEGGKTRNPLKVFDRWKIFDNLRRSSIPVANLALLFFSWLISPGAGSAATMVVLAQFLFHSLVHPFTWAGIVRRFRNISVTPRLHNLIRMVLQISLLPYQAWVGIDAAVRALYRKHISHRGMLEWTTAQETHGRARSRIPGFIFSMCLVSLFSVTTGYAIQSVQPDSFRLASVWLALWFLSPLIGWFLNWQPAARQLPHLISNEDRQFLRAVSRRTWRYFTDFVNEETCWLPPDNYQVAYKEQLALRTSPTNIGLYMVSILSANDFGYASPDEVIYKLEKTMETIEKLERYDGHLLNWYDIQTLEPLRPRYVSTVDSGNFLGALWALDPGLEELVQKPLISSSIFDGLLDTLGILRQINDEKSRNHRGILDKLESSWKLPPERIIDLVQNLYASENLLQMSSMNEDSAEDVQSIDYWTSQMQNHVASWLALAGQYLSWIEILAEKTDEEISRFSPEILTLYHQTLRRAPSIQDLAGGQVPIIKSLMSLRENTGSDHQAFSDWINRILNAFHRSELDASALLTRVDRLRNSIRNLSASINMNFLYNSERRLFSIGFNVTEGRLDRSFYDLLASEARLGSYIAIARGDIPVEHWFAIGRPYGAIGRRRALLSWTGTMFEYLMPLLFQRSFGNSLLNKTAREAVEVQMAYAKQYRVPWGISECAFGDLDIHKTYQYQAFGVPDLGLKRGMADKIVIAPYATLLAVNVAPRETVQNLRRLAGLGLLSDYGYYEALDYSQPSNGNGEQGTIVQAYMAHHHGMSFLALTNFLHDNAVQRRFHADPRVRSVEPLLQERIPDLPPLHHISTRERVSTAAEFGEVKAMISLFETPHTTTPKTQLLSNGSYSLMLTNAGGGYSRWKEYEITRWRSDRTLDSYGTFCFIHEPETNHLWCNSYQPTAGVVEGYSAHFTLDLAVFRRVDHSIECETEIVIEPEDDVEIRRITLINRSQHRRHLELTSYLELAMAPHNADRQHPALSKLFIQTEALGKQKTLLAHRRLRSSDETPVFVAHRFTVPTTADEDFRYETDRARFIGRGCTLVHPRGAVQEPGNNDGFTLDPILSIRQDLTLDPGERVQVSMVVAVAETREEAIDLVSQYDDSQAVTRALDMAWASAQLELRLLRIHPEDARRFQQLASHLLYPNPLLRTTAKRIAENRKGQAGLWAYAISGDLPIVLIAINETMDLHLIHQMLKAHTYWQRHGLVADLVILNEEAGGYEHPLREQLEYLIQDHKTAAGIEPAGGIHLLSAELIPQEDLTLLRTVASVVMVAARGGLHQQLGLAPKVLELPEPITLKSDRQDPSATLPFMELDCFNGLGGFSQDGREYVIYLDTDDNTPAPWVNVIANPGFGTLISETGSGFTWQGNSQRNRLTPWSNDPVMDPSSEAIYIRDEETGAYWTPTASPIREENDYRTRHGAGYSIFEHNSHGIEQELTVFVPVDDRGGEPVKLQRLQLRNDSSRPRELSVTYYVEWILGETRESSQMHVVTDWDDEIQAVTARNSYHPDYPDRVAFAALSLPTEHYTGDRTVFIGRNRTLSNPAAMERVHLSHRIGAGLDPCAGLQVTLNLAPGETIEITCMLGQAISHQQVRDLVQAYRDRQAVEITLEQTKEWWDNQLGSIRVKTPEPAADIMINRWLSYQNLACRIWGRSAFYQSGGAFGFRDQLQDMMALLYTNPSLAREHILLAASRQFKEGDVQHWWHPPLGDGVRTRISDDLLWLPYVVAQYVRITAKTDILSVMIPFLEAPLLSEEQHDCYQSPAVSSEWSSLFEHCQRAVRYSQKYGNHGLPLMGTGDWNDGMNLVGSKGAGESVWMAWFLVEVLNRMAEMSDHMNRSDLRQHYEQERESLLKRIDQSAWDGEWYLRATFDDGTPLGSKANTEAQIDSLPQSWAWLSGGGDPERASLALESAWKHLVREDHGLVLLFEPPFDNMEPSPGYIKSYPPGVRENGGQYTHAAVWMAMAMARSRNGERAVRLLRMLNPIENAKNPDRAGLYRVEPYTVAADVYNLAGKIGMGGWSWYTGSAAWMYRAWVEEILGLKVEGNTMWFDPVIPGEWDGFQMAYQFGKAIYEIQVDNPDHRESGVSLVELDGQRVVDGKITLNRKLIKHRILVRMGEPAV